MWSTVVETSNNENEQAAIEKYKLLFQLWTSENPVNPSFALFTKNSQKNGGDGLKTPVKSRGQF